MTAKDWRLAFMFDAAAGDVEALASALARARGAIEAAARGHPLRFGVAIRDGEESEAEATHEVAAWRTVDGAIEVTVPAAERDSIVGIARSMKPLLEDIAAPGSVEVMTGPVYPMVPVREGDLFLSLAFRRDPAITVDEFRDWWFNGHSKVAIPVLGAPLLAYDQVHVEPGPGRAAAEALGVAYVDYDAYDNLTWASRASYVESISDAYGMARVAEDEVGHIDNATRRYALMREIR